MTSYLGIDLAWAQRARTGLAVLDVSGRIIASSTVVKDDEIARFVAEHVPGEVVVAIDAPLVVPNATGRRDCEAELGWVFGAFHAGAHPTNRSKPYFNPTRGAELSRALGWDIDPSTLPGRGRSVAIEVYPHPAMITLFELGTVIPYKAKPGRDVVQLRGAFVTLLDHLERVAGATLRLSELERWHEIRAIAHAATRKSQLGAIEDEVDAIFCAYLAWLWGQQDPRMKKFGDIERGYIVVPGPPTTTPARRHPGPRLTSAPGPGVAPDASVAEHAEALAAHVRATVPTHLRHAVLDAARAHLAPPPPATVSSCS